MDVFISHSVADKPIAKRLAHELQAAGLSVWDDEVLMPGDKWMEKISDAISSSKFVLVLLSKDSVKSSWVSTEAALSVSQLHKFVIPVLIDKNADIPSYMRDIQALDLSKGDQSKNEIEKLIRIIKQGVHREGGPNVEKDEIWRKALYAKKSALSHEIAHFELETNERKKKLSIRFTLLAAIFTFFSFFAAVILFIHESNNTVESFWFINVIIGVAIGLSSSKLVDSITEILSNRVKKSKVEREANK